MYFFPTTSSSKNAQIEATKKTRLYRAVTNVFNTATLDIFQLGQPIILGQDLKFFSKFLDGEV